MYAQYMCILLYVKLMWCNSIPYTYCQLEWGYIYPRYMCILLYMKLMWCNGIPYIYCQLRRGYMYPQYMCILLYMKLIWCNVIPHIYCQLGGRCVLSICAFCYMWNLFGVTIFYRSIVNWSMGVHVSSVYGHSAIVKLMWCNSIS